MHAQHRHPGAVRRGSRPGRLSAPVAVMALGLLLAGCHLDDNGNGRTTGGNDGVGANAFAATADQPADSEPRDPDAALQSAIDALFGGADTDPVAVQDGDTLDDVIGRAGG